MSVNELLSNISSTPLKEFPVIIIIDTSVAMTGFKIASINNAVRKVIEFLNGDLINSTPTIKPMIACIEFNYTSNIVIPYQEAISVVWYDLTAQSGSNFGETCKLLYRILGTKERGGILSGRISVLRPIIVVISEGYSEPYISDLSELKKRGWYIHALKFGIAIGQGAEIEMLNDFTGSSETVFTTDSYATNLEKMLLNIIHHSYLYIEEEGKRFLS